jgi:hypothetical protein
VTGPSSPEVANRGGCRLAVTLALAALGMANLVANVRRSPSWSRLVVQYFGDQALAVLGRVR